MIKRTFEDIDNAVKATGAAHKFELVDGSIIYSSKPLTEEQKNKYQKEAQEGLDAAVECISKEIDKHILERIMKDYGNKKRK